MSKRQDNKRRDGLFSDLGANAFLIALFLFLQMPHFKQPASAPRPQETGTIHVTVPRAGDCRIYWGISLIVDIDGDNREFFANGLPDDEDGKISVRPASVIQDGYRYVVDIEGHASRLVGLRVFVTDLLEPSRAPSTLRVNVSWKGTASADLAKSGGTASFRFEAGKPSDATQSEQMLLSVPDKLNNLGAPYEAAHFSSQRFSAAPDAQGDEILRIGPATTAAGLWLTVHGVNQDLRWAYAYSGVHRVGVPGELTKVFLPEALRLRKTQPGDSMFQSIDESASLAPLIQRLGIRSSIAFWPTSAPSGQPVDSAVIVGWPDSALPEAQLFTGRYDSTLNNRAILAEPGLCDQRIDNALAARTIEILSDKSTPLALGGLGLAWGESKEVRVIYWAQPFAVVSGTHPSSAANPLALVATPAYRIGTMKVMQNPLVKVVYSDPHP